MKNTHLYFCLVFFLIIQVTAVESNAQERQAVIQSESTGTGEVFDLTVQKIIYPINDPCSVEENKVVCEQNNKRFIHNMSLYEEAKKTKNKELCKKMEGSIQTKENCYRFFIIYEALTSKDENKCAAVDNIEWRDKCKAKVRELIVSGGEFEFPPFQMLPDLFGTEKPPIEVRPANQ